MVINSYLNAFISKALTFKKFTDPWKGMSKILSNYYEHTEQTHNSLFIILISNPHFQFHWEQNTFLSLKIENYYASINTNLFLGWTDILCFYYRKLNLIIPPFFNYNIYLRKACPFPHDIQLTQHKFSKTTFSFTISW